MCEQSHISYGSVERWVPITDYEAILDDAATCVIVPNSSVKTNMLTTCGSTDAFDCICERKKNCYWSEEFDDRGRRRSKYISVYTNTSDKHVAEHTLWNLNHEPLTLSLAMDVAEQWR